jgi:hypothetical protein
VQHATARTARFRGARCRDVLDPVDGAGRAGLELAVGAFGDAGDGDDALRDAVEIDGDARCTGTRGPDSRALRARLRGDTRCCGVPVLATLARAGVPGLAAAVAIVASALSGSSGLGAPFFSTAMYSADVTGWSYDVMSSQPLAGPKFVLARNQRYLPLASHAGDVASARPSVSWWRWPDCTS